MIKKGKPVSHKDATTEDACSELHKTKVLKDKEEWQWPIIYHAGYNIGFLGFEKLHPFDSSKWGNVVKTLKDKGMLHDTTIVVPEEAEEKDLLIVHSKSYLNSLRWSITVAGITEVPPVALLPNFIVQRRVLKPFRLQTGGTILGAKLAVEHKWAINIGGGFHHCCAEKGGGFCAYADITLAIRFLFMTKPHIKKAMIVDLDAHQGNGHERDFMNDTDKVYIMDVYNRGIYPRDGFAKRAIRKKIELQHFTEDREYLEKVKVGLDEALAEFTPDFMLYNAGTDILDNDPLGTLSISAEGIIARDELVFREARHREIPILLVTSGGYQRVTADIIAKSILNLRDKELISCEAAEEKMRELAQRPAGRCRSLL